MSEDLHTLPDAPTLDYPGRALKIVNQCAWCPNQPVPEGYIVSHGICERHAAEMRAYMKTTMERELQTAGEPAESKTEI